MGYIKAVEILVTEWYSTNAGFKGVMQLSLAGDGHLSRRIIK